jgi:glutamate synthase domain-containing protein 1
MSEGYLSPLEDEIGQGSRPAAEGLFDPALERDACGVGFIANLKGRKSHAIVEGALKILENLEHRGAVGADPLSGDGAGILIQIPHDFALSFRPQGNMPSATYSCRAMSVSAPTASASGHAVSRKKVLS